MPVSIVVASLTSYSKVSLKSSVFNISFPVKLKMMYIGEEQLDSPDGTSAATK